MKLWRSGIVWSVLSFVGGLGNFVFARIIAEHLPPGEFGNTNTVSAFIGFLSLLPGSVNIALVHYIAHFRGHNDEARLQGLLAGCQKFLFQVTIAGSLLALALAGPLAKFVGYRPSLVLAALAYLLVSFWSTFGLALCQGMSWFKRIAVIGLIAVVMRLLFGWVMVKRFPTAEMAVTATTFSFLANLSLFYWWKDIFRHGALRISPWTREFLQFLLVAASYVAGNWFFLNGQELVAKKFFSKEDLDAYEFAARWCLALPGSVLPLLLVMFSSRSGSKISGQSDQRILLGLYAVGLGVGAAAIVLLREFLVRKISGRANPAAAGMMVPFTIAMTFAGLSQAIGLWSLGSRWLKTALLYGMLGLGYWVVLLWTGHTPETLLRAMPLGTGAAFVLLATAWLVGLRGQRPAPAQVPA